MKRSPAVISPETDLFAAASLMAAKHIRHLPVVDDDHRPAQDFERRLVEPVVYERIAVSTVRRGSRKVI